MEIEDKTFSLLVRSLLDKGIDKVDTSSLSPTMKSEFEKVAQKFVANGSYVDAIGTYAMIGKIDKLIEIGKICLKKCKNEWAFEAFKYADDKEGLVDVGSSFLGEGRLRDAYVAFKLSGNQEMINFFEVNFKEGIDYYV